MSWNGTGAAPWNEAAPVGAEAELGSQGSMVRNTGFEVALTPVAGSMARAA